MIDQQLDQIHEYLDRHFQEHLEELKSWLRIEHTAASSKGIQEGVSFVTKMFEKLDADIEIIELKNGNPVVYAKLISKNAKAKTVIHYNKYDTVTSDEPDWIVPPYSATVMDAQSIPGIPSHLGKVIVSRGTSDSKSPQFVNYKAIEAIQAVTGDIPLNYHLICEGEHEILSPHLGQLNEVDTTKNVLKQADGFMQQSADRGGSDKMGFDMKKAAVRLGWKGAIGCDLSVKGGEWGGPKERDLEVFETAWIDAPSWRLTWALNSLQDPSGKILIDGFYDDIRPLTMEEREYGLKLRKQIFVEEEWKKLFGIDKFRRGLPGEELFLDRLFLPEISLRQIHCGRGVRSQFPKEASAKILITLQPNQTPQDIIWKLRKHLNSHGFPEVKVTVNSYSSFLRVSPKEGIAKSAINALKRHNLEPVIWPTFYASGPQSPIIHVPYANGCAVTGGHNHQANEYVVVDTLLDGAKFFATWCYEFAELLPPLT